MLELGGDLPCEYAAVLMRGTMGLLDAIKSAAAG